MCIALLSTAHPDFALIALSNRDEFITRPTAPAAWWATPNSHVLGGRDLQRAEHGTWLGVTNDGRIAILTNFREEGQVVTKDKSRGGIVTAYLTSPPHQAETDEAFAHRLIETVGIDNVGGFSLCFGQLQGLVSGSSAGLSILSNRTSSAAGLVHILGKANETRGLSNSHFGDQTWPKVVHGEALLNEAISNSVAKHVPVDELLERLFAVLSVNTLPAKQEDEDWNTYTRQLRSSIFVPAFGGEVTEKKSSDEIAAAQTNSEHKFDQLEPVESVYGTQKQTVILVTKDGRVTFVERTLYDGDGKPLARDGGEKRFEFKI